MHILPAILVLKSYHNNQKVMGESIDTSRLANFTVNLF